MTTHTPLLLSWSCVESLGDLERLRRVLDALPDAALIAALEKRRGRGRNDYPVRAMWRALVAGMVFQHPSIEALLRELNRNPALLDACGFHPVPTRARRSLVQDPQTGVIHVMRPPERSSIPSSWNVSRFVACLLEVEEEEGLLSQMIVDLRHRLMDLLPDFGAHLGCDGTAMASKSTGTVNTATGQTSDKDADWGKHETKGVTAEGKVWTKVTTWFGYTLHLIADTTWEIPVAAALTKASASEVKTIETLLEDVFADSPDLATRCTDLSADRGYDSGPLKETLWETWRIRPIIDVRQMWRDEKAEPGHDRTQRITRPLHADRADTIVYTERGEVRCVCPETGTERDLAFHGFETTRGTLKYRCPAATYGFDCKGRKDCEAAGDCHSQGYGRIVRVPLDTDRRIFTPTPRSSLTWQHRYRGRTALERINARLDQTFGLEHHHIRGVSRMTARITLALAVMMALAQASIGERQPHLMRSLVRAAAPPDPG
ncbi:MAG: transposase [Rhodospirillaceae bacterium]|nr:transposase [Rhodospirillaceae bacterium]